MCPAAGLRRARMVRSFCLHAKNYVFGSNALKNVYPFWAYRFTYSVAPH
jgi:hypothetical protein